MSRSRIFRVGILLVLLVVGLGAGGIRDCAGKHVQDGIWHFRALPTEPDIPEALPPADQP